MQGFASSKPEYVEAAIKEYSGKSLEEAKADGIKAGEILNKFWEQTKLQPDFKGVTVFGEGLGNEEVTERYAKAEAQAQGCHARIKAINEAQTAEDRNELRLEVFKAERAGNPTKAAIRKTLEEMGIEARTETAVVESPIARFADLAYKDLAKDGPHDTYDETAVLSRFSQGKLKVKGAGHDLAKSFQLAAGDAAIPRGVKAEGGGSPTWSPRDLTRIVESLRGEQYPPIISLIGSTPWGYEMYKYLEEDSTVNAPSAGPAEGYPTKDGIVGAELQYHEVEKTVTVRDFLVFTRFSHHMLKYDMEFVNRVERRQVRDLLRRIDYQILNGNGAAANDASGKINGLIENASTQAQPAEAAVNDGVFEYGVDYIVRARGNLLKDAGATPTFVVMPVDHWARHITVRTNFGMRVNEQERMVGGMTLVPTDLMENDNTVLIGDGNECTGLFGPDLEMDMTRTARTSDYEKGIVTVRTLAYYNQAIFRPKAFHTITAYNSRVEGTKT